MHLDRKFRLLSVCAAIATVSQSAAVAAGGRLGVLWTDSDTGAGVVGAISTASPWPFETPPLQTDPGVALRSFGGILYVVSRAEGTITVVDTGTWTPQASYFLGVAAQPLDIAVVSPQLAYVTRAGATHLLRLDPRTGDTAQVVDLSVFADADGVPDMGMMAMHDGRLFIQIRKLQDGLGPFSPPAYLAVVDIATEQLVDADPATPGVQAVELLGTFPKFKMQVVPQTRRLFVSATGEFFDAGGIEMIDLDTLQSLGFAVDEAADMVGADVGAFVMVTSDRGFFVSSTDLALSSHLQIFTVSGGVEPGPALHDTLEYFAPTLEFDPEANLVFFPDGGTAGLGVHVFDAATGDRLTTEPVATNGRPTDVVVVDRPAAIPAISVWGVATLVVLILAAGTLAFTRRAREPV